ncbi:MAG: hypothetical protein JNJ54_33940 [Myxococcaceae bacterium]|nr:hypothetical protein [Myxococcaceae bacterium]
MRRAWILVVSVAAATCRPTTVNPVEASLRVSPRAIDLGRTWTQTTVRTALTVTNDSRAGVEIAVAVTGAVFSAPSALSLAPGDNELLVSATSGEPGPFEGQLSLLLGEQVVTSVPLSVEFREPPDCGQASECATLRFDRATSQCLIEPRADGLACGGADRCLRDGRCMNGECLGQPVACDDGDQCTIDVCETVRGCVALPRQCPAPSPCLVGVCVPDAGCAGAPVPDGTRCGDLGSVSCTSVQICLNGQCVERDPPDGYLCAPASPCRGPGRCEDDACVLPLPAPLEVRWSLGEPPQDGGVGDQWSDVFLDDDGGVVLSSYFGTAPMVQAPTGQRLPAPSRRCISWNDLVVCADTPPQGVTASSARNGLPAWVYSQVLVDLPALALPDWETFLARLVGLGPTRLGVLFESRRIEERRETNCRRFSFVVLDQNGQRVVARIIDDPIFLVCNHPHSYGVAADPQGNIFFAFTPSANVSPALPDPNAAGTVIVSYSPAGVRRWRHFVPNMPGGEIATGRGLITVEAGRSIYDAARGVAIDDFSIPFGEGLIAQDWVVAGPKGLQVELRQPGLDAGVQLVSQAREGSRSGLRGAGWSGAQVALRLVAEQGNAALEAFPLSRFLSGRVQPLWRCEIPDGGSPVSFEIKPDGLVLMTDTLPGGAGLCENCDPPWALTRSRFLEVKVPGLIPPEMPWPGPWGGPHHDHRED